MMKQDEKFVSNLFFGAGMVFGTFVAMIVTLAIISAL